MLHIFYRYCGRENSKPRPAFYSKALCLKSCLLAFLRIVDARFTFISDGPISSDVTSLIDGLTTIIKLPGVGEAQSFIFALQEAARCESSDHVYFVEDDYLHCTDALMKIVECSRNIPSDYITLFDDPLRYKLTDDVPPDLPVVDPAFVVSSSHHWRRIESTTLTFCGRVRTIQEDLEIFSTHVLRRSEDKRYIADRECWRHLQGLGNYASSGKLRTLISAIPSLATHCELTALSPTINWNKLATEIAADVSAAPLAIQHGIPAKTSAALPMMPGALEIGAEEEQAVMNVIRSHRLGRYASPWETASQVTALEQRFAEYMKSPTCLAVSSGTAALHCALVGLGIGPGDEVIVPAYTWMSSATAVCNVGAVPIIADIDATLTIDPTRLEDHITPYTRAILVVHMRGAPARMDAIQTIAKRHDLLLIEDTAQAMGASFHGRRLGTIGDIGCFSLQSYKILCTGEGGLLLAHNEAALKKAIAFHGAPPGEHPMLSMNYRMSELTGAVGLVQLRRLDGMLERMRHAKRRVRESLEEIALRKPIELREEVDSRGDAAVSVTFFAESSEKANIISDALCAENIGNFRLYRPGIPDFHFFKCWTDIMNKQPLSPYGGPWRFARREIAYATDMCPRATNLLGRAIDININPQFSKVDIDETIRGLYKVLSRLA